ncbi:MAG: DUF4491 family protein [Bacteroidales bacterium]|jgi:uncharacterized membrane protein|nr:DUF4491 family protein [Bacteroidales bacterium]
MNYTGLLVGLATFLIIGLFHPLVIKAEYYLGVKSWWIFALSGIIFSVLSILAGDMIWSTILGVTAFSSFWSILEVFEQKKRVQKGWFPKGPGHTR